jgi:hypothetical protein
VKVGQQVGDVGDLTDGVRAGLGIQGGRDAGQPVAASIRVRASTGSCAMARRVCASTGQPTEYSTRMPASSPSGSRFRLVIQFSTLWVAPAPSMVMSRLCRHGAGICAIARGSRAMWSSASLAPAVPGRSRSARHSPVLSQMTAIGCSPTPGQGGRRRHRAEQIGLVAQHVDAPHGVGTVGHHHRRVGQHPAPVTARGEALAPQCLPGFRRSPRVCLLPGQLQVIRRKLG